MKMTPLEKDLEDAVKIVSRLIFECTLDGNVEGYEFLRRVQLSIWIVAYDMRALDEESTA